LVQTVNDKEDYTAVILAAGRGSRLGSLTDQKPKCLVELGGKPLLHWQISALTAGGIQQVYVVTGYRRDLIEAQQVETIHNPEWSHTNMVGTLLCAIEQLSPPFIVSYSDIVYSSELVRNMLASSAEVAIAYDTAWLELWKKRFDDPLADAQTFRIDHPTQRILEIGRNPTVTEEIQGQFMGLMKFSAKAVEWICDLLRDNSELRNELDSTSLIMKLIDLGRPVYGLACSGGCCEIDDDQDLSVAEGLLADGTLVW